MIPTRIVAALACALASPAALAASPCAADPAYAAQDFTLGTWDVLGPDGKKQVEVRIEKQLGGCTLVETWTGLGTASENGLGLFTWSRMTRGWHYHWAADNGTMTVFTGTAAGPGAMRYITDRILPDGHVRKRVWTLTLLADGRVRELAQGSNDDGLNWTTDYELIWTNRR